MNTWIKLLEDIEAGYTAIGITLETINSLGVSQHCIHIYDSLLRQNGNIKKSVSKFNISNYMLDMKASNIAYQPNNTHDIVMENMYVKYNPFKVYFHKEGIIYIPNILYKNCQVTLRKGINHSGIFYDSCVVNYK